MYAVREQVKSNNPEAKSEVARLFKTFDEAQDFVSVNYNKNGYPRLYVSEV